MYHADSSAAIFVDGKLIAASEEERFRRIKHWAGFPSMSIEFCLNEANVTIDKVDAICIGRDPYAKIFSKIYFTLFNFKKIKNLLLNRLQNRKKIKSVKDEFANLFNVKSSFFNNKIHFIEHHKAHLASSFFASSFNQSAILSIDGSGDFTTTMLAIGHNNKIKIIDSINFPTSVGLFYTAFTQYLGFYNYGDEYKIMGLAPYGNPIYIDKLKKIIFLKPNGLFDWDKSYFVNFGDINLDYTNNIPTISILFSNKFESLFGKSRKPSDEISQFHKDLASSVQFYCEEIIIHLINHLHSKTGLKNICIAGGVSQNSVANGKIIAKTNFEKIYIPSAGHDAGLSIGAALYYYNQILSKPRIEPLYSAFTGSHYTNQYIENLLISKNIKYSYYNDEILFDVVTDMLIKPGVVGWFTGKAEFGPRALGARSIIADPRNPNAKELLNLKIKKRESFRPFAPSILKEYVSEYFTISDNVPFMEKVFPIKIDKQTKIPAVTHVDGTGRLQTVCKDISPRYYGLIEKFMTKTGVPILLNTSFNENEPIVNSPEEALNCFLRTEMDMLVLENFIITR